MKFKQIYSILDTRPTEIRYLVLLPLRIKGKKAKRQIYSILDPEIRYLVPKDRGFALEINSALGNNN